MSDYDDLLAAFFNHQVSQGLPWNTTANTQAPANTLTLEKLRAMMDQIPPPPPNPGVDLYGHDLLDQEQAFTIDRRKMNEQMYAGRSSWMRRYIVGADLDRQMVIVPRARLHETFRVLKESGVDVRLEPRYSLPKPRESRFPPATKPKEPDADGEESDR